MKNRYLIIFIIAFILNFIWENAHSFLYVHYQNQKITEFILLRAAIVDAVIITIMAVFFSLIPFLKKRKWLSLVFGILIAIGMEWYALSTGRWSYNSLMPIIPFINTGLTPTLQLGVLAYITFYLAR